MATSTPRKFNAMLESVTDEHSFRRLHDLLMRSNCRIFNKKTGIRANNFHRSGTKVTYYYLNAQNSKGTAEWHNLHKFFVIKETLA